MDAGLVCCLGGIFAKYRDNVTSPRFGTQLPCMLSQCGVMMSDQWLAGGVHLTEIIKVALVDAQKSVRRPGPDQMSDPGIRVSLPQY